jgi:hypothetical protein
MLPSLQPIKWPRWPSHGSPYETIWTVEPYDPTPHVSLRKHKTDQAYQTLAHRIASPQSRAKP